MSTERTVIEARRWVSPSTGRTASIYGSAPWTGDKGDWHIEVVGWTIEYNFNGRVTVGNGRVPFKTKDEAEAFIAAHPY